MSGVKISRTENENRFKKGMYPTENDFANAFASFVHKDDTISMSQVTLGDTDETIGEVIDKKADKKNLEDFIKDVDTILETVRDKETGEISKTVIQDLSKRIEDAENDLANTSNTAEQNESAIAKILSILGKQEGETVSELAEKFTALSGDYATVYAFVSKVKTFLESADVADTTINRWQEIESFLQGITDKETLTGLLQEMKQEIIDQIPEPQSNYLEQVEDLDDYTDAPEGKIVQYIGQTNEKYTRGFMYERVKNNPTTHTEERTIITLPTNPKINGVQTSTNILREVFLDDVDIDTDYYYYYVRPLAVGKHAVSRTACKEIGRIQEGYGYYDTDNKFISRYSDKPGKARFFEIDDTILVATETVATNVQLYVSYLSDDHTDLYNESNGNQRCLYNPIVSTETVEVEDTTENPLSWQLIPVSPVIS